MQPNEPQTPDQASASLDQQQGYAPQPVQAASPAPVQQPFEQPASFVPPVQQQVQQPEPLSPQQPVQENIQTTELDQPLEDEYQGEDADFDGPTELPEFQPINWQAQEYLQYEKSPLWYIIFGIVVCVLVGVAIFLQAWTFVALVPVMAVALVVYAHRPPHVVNYALSEKGLHVNDMLHPMGEFKTFSVVQSANPEQNQLVLIPVKRFRPSLTVFFPSSVGEQLVDTVGAYLPSQPYKPDAFDKIIQKLRI